MAPLGVDLCETPRHLGPKQVCTALIGCGQSEHPANAQGSDSGRNIPYMVKLECRL
jgi:hypothetical protein